MNAANAEIVIRDFLKEVRSRLDEAASITRAAEACADASNVGKAVEIALGIDQPLYEITTLLNAASLINRISDLIRILLHIPFPASAPWPPRGCGGDGGKPFHRTGDTNGKSYPR